MHVDQQPPIPPSEPPAAAPRRGRGRRWLLAAAGLLIIILAALFWGLHFRHVTPNPTATDWIDVPLGVEEAVIIRFAGPQLIPRPYRRGASVSLRVARQERHDEAWVYDVRYVVNLPGEFNLTDYLTSIDGSPLDRLPAFRVRGVTRLTKDIETRIREIEEVDISIWHWYYETLIALALFWVVWLLALIVTGRARRQPAPPIMTVAPLSLEEQIQRTLGKLLEFELSVEEKASLEVMLLRYWSLETGLKGRLADKCTALRRHAAVGPAYEALQSWLHAPRTSCGPQQLVTLCRNTGLEAAPGEVEGA